MKYRIRLGLLIAFLLGLTGCGFAAAIIGLATGSGTTQPSPVAPSASPSATPEPVPSATLPPLSAVLVEKNIDIRQHALPEIQPSSENQSFMILDPDKPPTEDNIVGLGATSPSENARTDEIDFQIQQQGNTLSCFGASNPETLPSEVPASSKLPPVRDQGGRGTCSFFAWAGLVDYLMGVRREEEGISPQFLSWLHQERKSNPQERYALEPGSKMVNEGATTTQVGFLLNNHGRPFSYGSPIQSVVPYQKAALDFSLSQLTLAERMKILLGEQTETVKKSPLAVKKILPLCVENNPTAVKAALNAGYPVIISIPVYQSFSVKNDQALPNIPDPSAQQTARGDHSVLLVGYKDESKKKGHFILRNSWGTDWGQAGYALISYDYIKQYGYNTWTAEIAPFDQLATFFNPLKTGGAIEISISGIPANTEKLLLRVSGEGFSPNLLNGLVKSELKQNTSVQIKVQVPSGKNRLIKAEAQNQSGEMIAWGSAVVDVETGKTVPITLELKPPAPPDPPTGLQVTNLGTTGFSLTWKTTLGANTYKVYRDGQAVAKDLQVTQYDLTGLQPETRYRMKVSAVNEKGEIASEDLAVTTLAVNQNQSGIIPLIVE